MECTSGDGLEDEDRDEDEWRKSDKACFCCSDTINYGDECIELRLVYISQYNGGPNILDALDGETGEFTEDPTHFCFNCWDAHVEDLREDQRDLFVTKKRSVGASSIKCCFCGAPFNWGDYAAYAAYGELDISPRTEMTNFVRGKHETVETAELLCMDCLEWINDNCEENIFNNLWVDGMEPTDEDLWWRRQAQGV
jgi:hypothetical protein